jgi:hypothetical protein
MFKCRTWQECGQTFCLVTPSFPSLEFQFQKAYETEFNQYIVQLLDLVDAMMRLGFYDNEDELILVIDPLISLLDGSRDIIDQDQLVRKNSAKSPSQLGTEGP